MEAAGLLRRPSRGDRDSKEGDTHLLNISFQKADSTSLLRPPCWLEKNLKSVNFVQRRQNCSGFACKVQVFNGKTFIKVKSEG